MTHSMKFVHCWEDGPRHGEDEKSLGVGSTCLLPDGHDGSHEWTRDDEFEVNFKAAGDE